mgnify:CR=1 FL=1
MKKIAAAVALMMMVAVPAMAADAPKADRPGGVLVEAVSFKATVDAIDSKTRKITLKMEDGSKTEFIAGDEVRNFAQIKKGDLVEYNFTQAIAIDVQKATPGGPKMGESTQMERAKLGEKPAGTVETTGYLTAKVAEIDHATRKVTLQMPEGKSVTFTAGDQVKRLNEISKGDEVVVQYLQKMTIKVTTPEKKKEEKKTK